MPARTRPSARAAAGLREQLAQEAARLMIEGGIEDFGLAKRKAAERFGVRSAGALPSNGEIQASLAERQRLFEPAAHDERLNALRRAAAQIMEYLAPFRPRLVGSVLAGTPTVNATIELHAFSDSPELVAALLETCGFALRNTQRRVRFGGQKTALVPGFSFAHDAGTVEVMTFPEDGAREAPTEPRRSAPDASRNAVRRCCGCWTASADRAADSRAGRRRRIAGAVARSASRDPPPSRASASPNRRSAQSQTSP